MKEKKEKKKQVKKRKKIQLSDILTFVAILIFCSPFAMSVYSSYYNRAQILDLAPPKPKAEIDQYNEDLLKNGFATNIDIPIDEPAIPIFKTNIKPVGSVIIPKIEETLPLYDGITEDALALGVAILDTTSFPTGKPNTNTVLTGHRGTPSQNIFKNLDKLNTGDFFYIDLGEKDLLRYKIREWEVVEPHETEKFQIEEGKAMATLVTCTPYLINSHRILMYADFDAYVPNENYGKDKDIGTQALNLASDESEIQIDEITKEEIIVNKKPSVLKKIWKNITLMSPVNLVIGAILFVIVFRSFLSIFVKNKYLETVITNVSMIFGTYLALFSIYYLITEKFLYIYQ